MLNEEIAKALAQVDPRVLLTSPLVITGIITGAAGYLLYALRTVPRTIFNGIRRLLSYDFQVNSNDHRYELMGLMLRRNQISMLSRSIKIDRHSTDKDVQLVPGYGRGVSRVQGVWVFYRCYQMDKTQDVVDMLDMMFLTPNRERIANILSMALLGRNPNLLPIEIQASYDGWSEGPRRVKRSFDTVMLDEDKKKTLLAKMRDFQESEAVYAKRGMPYKLIILLHGPPGTGKTSIIQALASEFGKTLKYVSNVDKISKIVWYCTPDTMMIFEDIDTLSDNLKRSDDDDDESPKIVNSLGNSKQVLGSLLNVFDGLLTPHGLVAIITTNKIEELDSAFVRPGRIDLLMEIGPLGAREVQRMFDIFYGEGAAAQFGLGDDLIEPITGALLQEILCNNAALEARNMIVARRPVSLSVVSE